MEKDKTQNKTISLPFSSFVTHTFLLLKKRWLTFLIIAVISGGTGFLWAWNNPVLYQSDLLFALDEGATGGSGGSLSSLASQFGLNVGEGNDIFNGDNILNIIVSRRMIEKVLLSIDTFDNQPQTLINYYEKAKQGINSKKIVDFPINIKKETLNHIQDSVLYAAYLDFNKNNIDVGKPDKFLNLFEIKVLTPNEKLTKVFTDKLISSTTDFYIELRSKKAKATLDILEQRVAVMKNGLNSSISERAAIQDANLNAAFAEAQAPLQKQQFNMQVYGTAYGELFKNLEIARYQYLKDIPLLQIIDPASYPMRKVKTSRLVSAIVFSIFSLAVALFIFWIIKIYKEPTEQNSNQ